MNEAKKVGRKYEDKLFAYKDVNYDFDGWADSSKFLPGDCDLCCLKIKDKKSIYGWHNGTCWDGLKYNEKDIVEYWKKKEG